MPSARIQQLVAAWTARLATFREMRASVDGAQLCELVLRDLSEIDDEDAASTVSLAEASQIGGYDRDSLARLIRAGVIQNAGKRRAPRIRRRDVPVKPGHTGAPPEPSDTSVLPLAVKAEHGASSDAVTRRMIAGRAPTFRTR